jgi:uncharacterized membrane protein
MIAYMLGLIFGHLLGHTMLSDELPVAHWIASIISLVEAKSLFENLSDITGQRIFGTVIAKLNALTNEHPQDPPAS